MYIVHVDIIINAHTIWLWKLEWPMLLKPIIWDIRLSLALWMYNKTNIIKS
jgi:hypothetical protein